MMTEIWLCFFIALTVFFLVMECATEVTDAFRFFLYKGSSTASVVGKETFSISRSRRLVEQKEDVPGYVPVQATQDRNSNYPYILSPVYWMYKKKEVFPILEWGTEGNTWRAHYPYARKWSKGSQAAVHYHVVQPWKYAVKDSSLGVSILLKCSVCILCIVICSILLMT